MSDGDAILRAIRAAPGDDAPRLIYADWLDEHSQPERAEFIRVQVELACTPDDHPERFLVSLDWLMNGGKINGKPCECRPCVLKRRIQELWDAGTYCGGFLEVPAHWGIPYWGRGFIESTQICAADCIARLDQIREQHPIREVRLTSGVDWHSPSTSGKLRLTADGTNVFRDCKAAVVYGWFGGATSRVIDYILQAEWPGITFHLPEIRVGDAVYWDDAAQRVVTQTPRGGCIILPWRSG